MRGGDVIDAGNAPGPSGRSASVAAARRQQRGLARTNGTRPDRRRLDVARAVVDFPVAYDQDLPQVRQTMKDTADQMWTEPRWHDVIMEEPEVWGVESVSSDAIVMRLVARTLPLRQWEVARELRERLKNALASASVPGEPVATAIGAGPAAQADAQARTPGRGPGPGRTEN